MTPVDIANGVTDDEVWHNFNTIIYVIEDEDIIFADVTNSSRSIPLMFMSLLNFAKVSKNIRIGGIFYGAYDNNINKDNSESITNILNLTGFDTVTDWSSSADMLLTKGGSKKFCDEMNRLTKEIKYNNMDNEELLNFMTQINGLHSSINVFFNALNFCDVKLACEQVRSISIETKKYDDGIASIDLKSLQKIKPLISLIEKIKLFIADFQIIKQEKINKYLSKDITKLSKEANKLSDEDQYKIVYNTMLMTDMCIKFDLYQQALTLLNENITSIITYEWGLNLFDKNDRENADKYLWYINDLHDGNKDNQKYSKTDLNIISEFYTEERRKSHNGIASIDQKIRRFRNAVNHANFQLEDSNISKNCKDICDCVATVKQYVNNMKG